VKIKIGPHLYAVKSGKGVERVLAGNDADGLCNTSQHIIAIDTRDLTASAAAEVFVHEVLHAIWDQTGLRNRPKDEEELVISSISPLLYQAIIENPDWVEYLTG